MGGTTSKPVTLGHFATADEAARAFAAAYLDQWGVFPPPPKKPPTPLQLHLGAVQGTRCNSKLNKTLCGRTKADCKKLLKAAKAAAELEVAE